MSTTTTQQDLNFQKLYIMGTGSAANSTEMASFNTMVTAAGGFASIDAAVDQHISHLVATQGAVSTIQAIAKNGFGVTLTSAQAELTITELVGAGIDSGSKLLNYLSSLQGDNGGTLDNRANAASGFLETLSASDKDANFAGIGVSTAVRNLLQNIDSSSASLANGNSGLNALSANLTATGMTGTVDHYLAGAIVFSDANGDGEISVGEWTSLTASDGTFVLPNNAEGNNVIVYGGTDLMTGNAFQGQLSASVGSTVVNPITTLIQAMVNSGQAGTVLAATTAIKAAFGLPANINLLSYNPLAVLASGSATAAEKSVALKVQTASQQIGTVIIHAANVADIDSPGATLQSAAAAVSLALAQAVAATSGTINLANSATVEQIIQAAFTATGATTTSAQVTQIANVTAASNAAAAASTNITQLAQVADVAQGSTTNALIAGATNDNFIGAENSFTNAALTSAIYNVTVGSVTPGVPLSPTASQEAASAAAAAAAAAAATAASAASTASASALKAPTGVALTTEGGTVIPNSLNSSNTNLTAVATIVAGLATDGKAELKIGGTRISTDATILSTDTSVTFNLNTADNAALQAAVAAGGVATVTLIDKYGNTAVSTLSNPTLSVDYAGTLTALTTANDNFTGTGANDIFNGTFGNGAGPYTFNAGDVLNGAGGSDTVNITTGAEASTTSDALWVNKTNLEKVIFQSTGAGAQDITGGTNFLAAFANGVELTAKTLEGAITIDLSAYTGTATINTITTGAAAHTIVTGSGVSTVNASGIAAGAQTINGVGLQTVNATINGAGDQTIGTTNGGNLVTVNATILAAGAQTITSTSNSNVTIVANATNGAQTINTAGGNDSVTTTGATGQSATINTGAGDDTIISGLGSDTITGGTGADTMTGGGGVDTFMFGVTDSVIGTAKDIITDFNKAGADVLDFGAHVLLTADTTALVAGSNVNTSAGGMISFHASDDTFAKKVIALQADLELDVANAVAMFIDGGNTYVYHAGAAGTNADDQLIQLTGITTLTTMIGGATLTIS